MLHISPPALDPRLLAPSIDDDAFVVVVDNDDNDQIHSRRSPLGRDIERTRSSTDFPVVLDRVQM